MTAIHQMLELRDSNGDSNSDLVVYLLIDCQSVVTHACIPTKATGQLQRRRNQILLRRINDDFPSTIVRFVWVPGHMEVEGNELADEMAKTGARKEEKDELYEFIEEGSEETEVKASLASVFMLFDKEILKQWSKIWRDSVVGNKLRQTDKNSPGRQIIKYHQDLSRRCSTILIQLRTG